MTALLLFSGIASASTVNFEGFSDSTILTTQYPGITFSNAIILTAGISLNEFEFPPHSGTNVVSDNGGPLSIQFATPAQSFSGYFTYSEPLTVDAYSSAHMLLATVNSAFSNNEALSGVPGSSPNEFLQFSFASGISSVAITGDPAEGSFALDDVTYSTTAAAVPEPDPFALFVIAALILPLRDVACKRSSRLYVRG